jgi:hypothetical protein
MALEALAPRALLGAGLLVFALGCREGETTVPAPAPAAPGDREILLARIAALDEVAPCVADGRAPAVRLVDADLAGDAASATFACANGAASGKVTFFRVAGAWTISTKEIRVAPRIGAQPAARSTAPEPAPASRTSVAPRAR